MSAIGKTACWIAVACFLGAIATPAESMADGGHKHCPAAKGRPLGDAFEHLPVVRVVSAKDEGDSAGTLAKLDAPGFAFDRPAHFPLPQFCNSGDCRMDDIGLVIYEGMRFVSEGDGRYQVRFVASAPAVPVVLRLRFHVGDCRQCCDVTLPPIRLPEKKTQKVEESEYLVVHEGYLPKILSGKLTHVERWGTARFGYGAIDGP